jgi:hypothetical protein
VAILGDWACEDESRFVNDSLARLLLESADFAFGRAPASSRREMGELNRGLEPMDKAGDLTCAFY